MTTTPTDSEKLQAVTEAIQEACPELIEYHPGDRLKTTPQFHTIRLEHVLRTVQSLGLPRSDCFLIDAYGDVREQHCGETIFKLDFTKPPLEQPELVDYLHILCK